MIKMMLNQAIKQERQCRRRSAPGPIEVRGCTAAEGEGIGSNNSTPSRASPSIPLWIEAKIVDDTGPIHRLQPKRRQQPQPLHRTSNAKRRKHELFLHPKENAWWDELEKEPSILRCSSSSNILRDSNEGRSSSSFVVSSKDKRRRLFEDEFDQRMPCLNASAAASAALAGRNILRDCTFATGK